METIYSWSIMYEKYYDPVVETMRKKQRLGANLALAYMSLISNTDVYSDMLERGATKRRLPG